MRLRFHEIAESYHRILNPLSEDKIDLLGRICRLGPGTRVLDLGCGKGEMLARWSHRHGCGGIGVDISEVFLEAAGLRLAELGVSDRVELVRADAGKYVAGPASFDIVSCLGATWIGNGLAGTLELMRRAVRPGGLLLVGEPYWTEPPPAEAYPAFGFAEDDFTSLPGTLDRFDEAGAELVELVRSDQDDWDRYMGPQWLAVRDWLTAHPGDPDSDELREWMRAWLRSHVTYGHYLGWGVFVLAV